MRNHLYFRELDVFNFVRFEKNRNTNNIDTKNVRRDNELEIHQNLHTTLVEADDELRIDCASTADFVYFE